MDQSFLLRAKRLLEQRPAERIDHEALVKAIAADRAASPTVAALARPGAAPRNETGTRSVAALLLGEPDWRRAAEQQGGCFNRAVAARRLNTR